MRVGGRGSQKERPLIRTGQTWVRNIMVSILITVLSGVCGTATVTEGDWKQAIGPREWRFPGDHGVHPEYRTEWWYFTGNLTDGNTHTYGYQLTFFRQGIVREAKLPKNSWSVRDLYLAHFAITDVHGGRFFVSQRVSRTGPGLAGSAPTGIDVWLLSWSARSRDGIILLTARDGEGSIELELRPRKPVVLHGKNGLSQKGNRPGQASYYASLTDLATSGVLKVPGSDRAVRVRGVSWFDHEFGSNQLSAEQVGWDWFGLHLSDGRDLMLYILRRSDGSADMASGTVVEPGGQASHVGARDMVIQVSKRWKSPQSGANYPARWTIRLPEHRIYLDIESVVPNQELITGESTGVIYWEGAVAGKGQSKDRVVTCEGYVELTGYAGSLKDTF